MLVKEYLNTLDAYQNVTFIKAVAQKDESSPFYTEVYHTTPIRQAYEWQKTPVADFYILNHKQCPLDWLSGAKWGNQFKKGYLKSLLIISKEDIEKLYSPKQAAEIIDFIGKEIKNEIRL
jgi:hypothetical protein